MRLSVPFLLKMKGNEGLLRSRRIRGALPNASRTCALVLIKHSSLYGAVDSPTETIIRMIARDPLWCRPNAYSASEVIATFRAATNDWKCDVPHICILILLLRCLSRIRHRSSGDSNGRHTKSATPSACRLAERDASVQRQHRCCVTHTKCKERAATIASCILARSRLWHREQAQLSARTYAHAKVTSKSSASGAGCVPRQRATTAPLCTPSGPAKTSCCAG